jgi:hypothetical protein
VKESLLRLSVLKASAPLVSVDAGVSYEWTGHAGLYCGPSTRGLNVANEACVVVIVVLEVLDRLEVREVVALVSDARRVEVWRTSKFSFDRRFAMPRRRGCDRAGSLETQRGGPWVAMGVCRRGITDSAIV